MTTANPRRGPVVIAALTASLLVLMLGLTYRVLAARLTPVSTAPVDANALEPFPMQIGDWKGEDVAIEKTVADRISADACINRRYSRVNSAESVSLFIAASGVKVGILVGHPPEICNVVNGYTLTDQRSVELALADATKLPCRILWFSRGGSLDAEKKAVLCYYMAGSEFCGSRSAVLPRTRQGSDAVNCVAQVQITASSRGTLSADSVTKLVSDFAVDSAATITRLFENLEKELSSGGSNTASGER